MSTLNQSMTVGSSSDRPTLVLQFLRRPRTQREIRRMLGMSPSGTLHLLRRMERRGLIISAERVEHTRIWERVDTA
jgi:predicted transcriptional regulator